jgi:hypothetical protein
MSRIGQKKGFDSVERVCVDHLMIRVIKLHLLMDERSKIRNLSALNEDGCLLQLFEYFGLLYFHFLFCINQIDEPSVTTRLWQFNIHEHVKDVGVSRVPKVTILVPNSSFLATVL